MTAVGETLGGKYRFERLLGEGGMGAVYAAENLNTGRRVAVKVLRGEWTQQPEVVQRFLREARATTTIAHPNVVEVLDLDVDRERGIPYIVQEFLEGETLEAHLASRPGRRVDPAEALTILLPVMGALVAAHGRGIVHRDLKPANLFLSRSRSGEVVPKVIDFGIAKDVEAAPGSSHRTQAGAAIGTPAYMSPEQVSGLTDIDAQTDVWSLGIVLYEMLTGRLPFESANVNVLMAKILYEVPTPIAAHRPDLPADLQAIVAAALDRERPTRFASVNAMCSALLACSACPSGVAVVRPSLDGVPARVSTPPAERVPGVAGTVPMQGMVTPHGTLPVQGLARSHGTQAMPTPPSNPWSSAIAPVAPDTMLAVARPVTSPMAVGKPSRSRWLLVSAAVVALGLVAVAVSLSVRGGDPPPTVAVTPIVSPVPRAAAAAAVPPPRPVAVVTPPPQPVAPPPPPVAVGVASVRPPRPAAGSSRVAHPSRHPRPATPMVLPDFAAPRAPSSGARTLNADEI